MEQVDKLTTSTCQYKIVIKIQMCLAQIGTDYSKSPDSIFPAPT